MTTDCIVTMSEYDITCSLSVTTILPHLRILFLYVTFAVCTFLVDVLVVLTNPVRTHLICLPCQMDKFEFFCGSSMSHSNNVYLIFLGCRPIL